jgi:hypothetical protein
MHPLILHAPSDCRYTKLDTAWYNIQEYHRSKEDKSAGGGGDGGDEEERPKTQEEIDGDEQKAGEELVESANQMVEMQVQYSMNY